MKRFFLLFLLIVGVSFCVFSQEKPFCIIAPFSTAGGISSDDAEATTELFTSQLAMNNKFRIVERRNLEYAYEEFNWQLSDWGNDDKVQQFGNKMNAKYVIRGQLIKMGGQYFLSSNILDLDTFEIVSSARQQFDDLGTILSVLPDFVSVLTEKLVPTKVPLSPIVGTWTSNPDMNHQTFRISATIEFLENGKINIHNWGYVKKDEDWWGNPLAGWTSGYGNYSLNGSYLEMSLFFNDSEMKPVRFSGYVDFAVGDTELSFSEPLSWGNRFKYNANSKQGYKVFTKN